MNWREKKKKWSLERRKEEEKKVSDEMEKSGEMKMLCWESKHSQTEGQKKAALLYAVMCFLLLPPRLAVQSR